MKEKKLRRASELWGKKADLKDVKARRFYNWLHHPFINKEYINKRVSGFPEYNWVSYSKEKYVPEKLTLGLSLGCGSGGLERHALQAGICEEFEAFDLAEGAIQVAREEAAKVGLSSRVKYKVLDINSIRLEADKYDIVLASSSIHHIQELEHVFGQVKLALKPAGFFIMDEFIGPSQFQWTEKQLSLCNQLLDILPNKYKLRYSLPGQIKEHVSRPALESMNALDPSEAIRSSEIVPLLSEYFEIVERIDYGGTILHYLLDDIVGNFSDDSEEDMAILKLLCFVEETLINQKVIPSDFAFLVVQNLD